MFKPLTEVRITGRRRTKLLSAHKDAKKAQHPIDGATDGELMNGVNFLLAPLVSALATLVFCLFARPVCDWLGILDLPDARKQHPVATPLMGGVILLFVVVPVAMLFILFQTDDVWLQRLLIWAVAVGVMSLLGLADDRHTLSARDRLAVSFLVFGSAAIVDPIFTVRVLTFGHPSFEFGVGTGWLALAFTAFCSVGLVNAVNMADGKNGLVIGLCIGWLCLLATRAPPAILPIFAILIAAWTVLLLFNLRGRLFLGDGGTYGIATAVGLLAIALYNTAGVHSGRSITADELMVLFSVPVLDSFRLTALRMREGRSPMSPDRNHFHHHLLRWFNWPGGLLVYWICALVPPFMLFTWG
jgi:UDP-GlcNAc:undecaprenyl-phosphate/decaprenyl-phosphate GlcNAc-1-phosphate transferase